MIISGEQLHNFDQGLCRHALDNIREHLHDPEIAAYVAEHLPASVLAYLQALGEDEEAPPMLLGDQELDELSWIFTGGPFQLDQPWMPYGPLYRRGLDCVTDVREALSREHAEHWAQASARFAHQLEGKRIYLGNGIQIIREWVAEARHLLRVMGRTDLLPAPEGAFPTPTWPKPPALSQVRPSKPPSLPGDESRRTTPTSKIVPPELSRRDAAQYLGISIDTLIEIQDAGLVRYRNASPPGSGKPRYRYPLTDLDRLMHQGYRRKLPSTEKVPRQRQEQPTLQTYEHLDLE